MSGFPNSSYRIIKKPGYRGVGLKWEGSWSQIHELKEVINKVSDRRQELKNAIEPDIQLGLSYHLRPDGFIHYSVFEVGLDQPVPDGMVEIYIPEYTYLMVEHMRGENIGKTYNHIASWLKNSNYTVFKDKDVTYYDPLPIKHERYPIDRDLDDPHFQILIPIVLRKQ